MASEYALNLKATLDTQQVQQELQKLRAAQMAASDGVKNSPNGQTGFGHVQKIENQLAKLNSSISGLQRAIEQLARSQGRTVANNGTIHSTGNAPLPIAPSSSNSLNAWLSSSEYKKFNSSIQNIVKNNFDATERQYFNLRYGGINNSEFAHNIMMAGGIPGVMDTESYQNQITQWNNSVAAQKQLLKEQQRVMRQNKQMATIIGGQLLGGIGSYATSFGHDKTGAVFSGLGEGVTAGGGAALGATMFGAGASVAGPVGIVVGLVAAAASITKAFMELEEAAKKAAEAQAKTAQSLYYNAAGQSLDRYGIYQKQLAEDAQKHNLLSMAKDQAKYFKEELKIAKQNFFEIEDPATYERRIRREAELKKNTSVAMQVPMPGATSINGYQMTQTVYGEMSDKDKAKVDKAANEAIEAHQKRFAAAKRELQAAEANAQVWTDVADKLKEAKEAGEKIARERRQNEAVERNALVRKSTELKYGFRDEESLRSTQIFANDILSEKNGPLSAFNKLSKELDRLRLERKDLRTQAFGINRNIELNGRGMTRNEVDELAMRRDDLLKRANVLGERADILETALGNIDVSKLAHKPDLSHVTSLAQYGFNMGEKDDTLERMERYYSKSINLQQQIKDKIQEGIKTEAIYN